MDNLYIRILEHLYSVGINQETEISHLFGEFLLQAPDPGDLLVNGYRLVRINDFLKKIVNDGFIQYVDLTMVPNSNIVPWIFPIKIMASLTNKGFEYIDRYKLNKSVMVLNDASLRNYKIQKVFAVITSVVVIIGSFFSALSFFRTESKMGEQNKNILSLKEKVEAISQEKKQQINPKAYLPDLSHKR